MRTFVFLLVLANLLFLAWTQGYLGAPSNPDAFRVQQQLLADQVTVVARDVPPPEVPAAEAELEAKPVTPKGADVCLLFSELPIAETDPLEVRLAEKFPGFEVVRTFADAIPAYWVFIPPPPSKKDLDTKVAELKKLGVPELFVVQESGPSFHAISLGRFSTKEAATSRLENLRSKGVKSAKVGERTGKPASVSLEMRGPEAQAEALRQAVIEALPEAKLSVCKVPAVAGQ